MKLSDIRKILIRQTIIVGVILTVVGGSLYYVISLDEDAGREISNLKTTSDSIAKQVTELTTQYNKATSNLELYQDIKQKLDNKQLTINKFILRDVIAEARNTYILDKLDVKLDQVKTLETPDYKKEKAVVETANVTIGLDSLTDLDILGLIHTLEKAFWGVKFTSLKFSITKDVDNAALITIKDTGFSPIVNAKFTFTLYGLKNIVSPTGDSLTEADGLKPAGVGK